MNKNWKKKRKTIRWQGIVKIQRPLATNGSYTSCLVYNEERSVQSHMELDEEQMAYTFPNGEPKTYWEAQLKWSGELVISKLVEEQPW